MRDDEQTFEQKAIREILNANVIEKRRARRWSIFFKLVFIIYIGLAFLLAKDNPMRQSSAGPAYSENGFNAIVDISGPIMAGKGTNISQLYNVLEDAFKHPNSKSVVLKINSPGGSPVQSNAIYTQIKKFKVKYNKPVIAYIEDVGASGAYWVACSADFIYADDTSIVGSIGVIMSSFGFSDAMNKLGIERRTYTAGENKMMLDPFAPEKEQDVKLVTARMDKIHKIFINLVTNSRGDRLKKDAEVFNGNIWLGIEATELGLIDGTGEMSTLVEKHSGTNDMYNFTEKQHWLDKLGKLSNLSVELLQVINNWWSSHATFI